MTCILTATEREISCLGGRFRDALTCGAGVALPVAHLGLLVTAASAGAGGKTAMRVAMMARSTGARDAGPVLARA